MSPQYQQDLPDLRCPFPYQEHPDYRGIEEFVLDWLRSSGVCADEDQLSYAREAAWGRLTSCLYPRGELERTKLIAQLLAVYCQLDEAGYERPVEEGHPEETAHTILVCHEAMFDPERPLPAAESAYVHAWRDVWLRLPEIANEAQRWRLAIGISHQMMGNACEALYASAGCRLGQEDARRVRHLASDTGTGFVMMAELTAGYELPLTEWARADVQRLARLVNDIDGCVNDIYGTWRDMRLNHRPAPNTAVPLMRERGISLDDAVQEMLDRYRDLCEQYFALADRIRPTADHELRTFLDDMELFCGGHERWHREVTQRYMRADNVFRLG